MNVLESLVRISGFVHFGIVAGNFALPPRLRTDHYLPRLSPILRQVFIVHWAYILLVLLIFGTLCVFFAPDLAGASTLGTAISAGLAVFWLPRVVLLALYYDRTFMKDNWPGYLAMMVACSFLAAVFSAAVVAAWGARWGTAWAAVWGGAR